MVHKRLFLVSFLLLLCFDICYAGTVTLRSNYITSNTNNNTRGFGIVIDEGGSVITTGLKGCINIPYSCTITKWTLLSIDSLITSGSITIELRKDAFANYPPLTNDRITSNPQPNITAHKSNSGTALTNWTVVVSAGDVICFYVRSVALLNKVYLIIEARQ